MCEEQHDKIDLRGLFTSNSNCYEKIEQNKRRMAFGANICTKSHQELEFALLF